MEAGIHINASCGGTGACGKCRVKIISGKVDSPLSPMLSQEDYNAGYRLACLSSVSEEVEVEIPIESQIDRSVLVKEGQDFDHPYLLSPKDIFQLVQGWEVQPTVFKRNVEMAPPT